MTAFGPSGLLAASKRKAGILLLDFDGHKLIERARYTPKVARVTEGSHGEQQVDFTATVEELTYEVAVDAADRVFAVLDERLVVFDPREGVLEKLAEVAIGKITSNLALRFDRAELR